MAQVTFTAVDESYNTIDSIALDAVPSEMHRRSNVVTDHPVERGANISDHSRPQPEVLELECLLTNAPIRGEVVPQRAEQEYMKLIGWMAAGQTFTVATDLDLYEDMILTDMSAPREAKFAEAVHFSCSFKRVLFVKSAFTKVKDKRVAKKKDAGPTDKKEVSPDEHPVSPLISGYRQAKDVGGGILKAFGFGGDE